MVESEVCFPLGRSVAFWRDDRGNSALYQPIDQPVRVIRLVSKESIRVDVFQKWFCLGDIGILSRCDAEFHRVAQSIADGMNFCRQTTPGSPDGLILPPFFRALALC